MRQWIESALVAYSAPSHCLNQLWFIANCALRNKLQWKFNQNTQFFINENASEKIVCEIAAILCDGNVTVANMNIVMSIVELLTAPRRCSIPDFLFLGTKLHWTFWMSFVKIFSRIMHIQIRMCKSCAYLIVVRQLEEHRIHIIIAIHNISAKNIRLILSSAKVSRCVQSSTSIANHYFF